jgi:hypothetical protein
VLAEPYEPLSSGVSSIRLVQPVTAYATESPRSRSPPKQRRHSGWHGLSRQPAKVSSAGCTPPSSSSSSSSRSGSDTRDRPIPYINSPIFTGRNFTRSPRAISPSFIVVIRAGTSPSPSPSSPPTRHYSSLYRPSLYSSRKPFTSLQGLCPPNPVWPDLFLRTSVDDTTKKTNF